MLDSDIRDQAYQFFIQEAPDLLHVIETELLTLRQDCSTAKIHSMMRSAHSIKGGAASVGLEQIKAIAHRLEDSFKALHHEELEVDAELETLFLQAFDCLRALVIEEIETRQQNTTQAQEIEPVFAALEARLEGFIGEDTHLPSSVELGVDIAKSIFEVDVAQGLECLVAALERGSPPTAIAAELRAQAEVFIGIAELLSLPGFQEIAQAALTALEVNPGAAHEITQLALADFQAAQAAILAGDRTQGGAPSPALIQLTTPVAFAVELADSALIWGDPEAVPIPTPDLVEIWGADENAPESGASPSGSETLAAAWALEPEALLDASAIDFTVPPSLETIWTDDGANKAAATWNQSLTGLATDVWVEQETEATAFRDNLDASATIPSVGDHEEGLEILGHDLNGHRMQREPIPALDAAESYPSNLSEETAIPLEPTAEASSVGQPISEWVQSIEQAFEQLPTASAELAQTSVVSSTVAPSQSPVSKPPELTTTPSQPTVDLMNQMAVRVSLDRLERMNNQIGELVINRNSLSLQNEQLLKTVQELMQRFAKFQGMANQLRDLSDKMLITPERRSSLDSQRPTANTLQPITPLFKLPTEFDSLELDRYGELHLLLQSTLEEIAQLEETTGDIALLSKQSSESLQAQRQMLGRLQDDLMWARMLPLGQVLNRFPRIMRDLSIQFHKPVNLKLSGTGVLVDKAVLEKLYNPLLHILRNAFDHGIETAEVRAQGGKPEQGHIEIRAYHRGSQTIIEIQDDGRGIDLERIGRKVVEMGWATAQQVASFSKAQLLDFIFQPGFSTANQVSELSGRGVGLDVVRSQLQALKGSITVTSETGRGTTFTLRIPLTLTVTKLLVCLVGSTAFALPSDSIEEILVPAPGQVKQSAKQRFLHWQESLVPVCYLAEILEYACPLPKAVSGRAIATAPTPEDWALPLLLLRQGDQVLALEVDRLATEQELVIKPFGSAIAPPAYIYGCTILGDGSLIPVLDGTALFNQITQRGTSSTMTGDKALASELEPTLRQSKPILPVSTTPAATVLIVDDSIALRQTLALTLQKAGYRVLQAKDGREALEQLQQNRTIQIVISDIEMPNMNGFEFLSHRRQDPALAAIPVAMLTSRSNDKHRKLALHLGADAYFTKPYIEQEFLKSIGQLINQPQLI